MANKIGVDASEVLGNLDRFADNLPSKLADGVEKAALFIEGEAKKDCTVGDSGILRASLTHYVDTEGTTATGYVGSNLEYAPYVHQGTGLFAIEGKGRKDVPWHYKDAKGNWHTTSGIHPKPFLQNAIDANRGKLTDFFRGLLEK